MTMITPRVAAQLAGPELMRPQKSTDSVPLFQVDNGLALF